MTEWSRKRRVMRHYDRIANIYDRQYLEEQTAKINFTLSHLRLDKKSSVTDVGCGTGILFPIIADKVHSIVGVDTSKKLLQKAKEYTKKFSNIHIVCADSDHQPLQNEIFNVVFATTLVQNIPNPLATLKEIRRTSKNQAMIEVTALKKEFTEKNFAKLLQKAQLEILTIKTDDTLKDHIALCQKQ